MPTHTTLDGRTLTYPEPAPELAAFLARVEAAAGDPGVSRDAMTLLVYGPDNPLLDHHMLPGRHMVTPAVWVDPRYRVMRDWMERKELREGRLDLAAEHARFRFDVPTAAAELGLTEREVLEGIDAYRIQAIFRGGQWWVWERAVIAPSTPRRGQAQSAPPAGAAPRPEVAPAAG